EQNDEARDDIQSPGRKESDRVAAKAFAEDHPARIENIDSHATGLAFEERQQLSDIDASQPALQQVQNRERAAPVVHGHDHLIDIILPADLLELLPGAEQMLRGNRQLLSIGLRVTDHHEAAAIRTAPQFRDRRRALAAAVHQNTPLEDRIVDDVGEYVSGNDE